MWTLSFSVAAATLCGSIIWVFSSALIHLSTPDKYLGRVFSFELAIMTLVMGLSNWGVGFAVDELGLTTTEVALWMGCLVTLPGLLWIGFLTFIRKRLRQGYCVGSASLIDPSGFNPLPMAREGQIKNKLQSEEK